MEELIQDQSKLLQVFRINFKTGIGQKNVAN